MAKQVLLITKKTRGRPRTGKGDLVGVRLQPAELSQVDAWRQQQDGEPSRPEAIRRLVRKGLDADPVPAQQPRTGGKGARKPA